ncbi:MAG: hypothetical protein HQK77_21830 [Desulfobacterales bacterium]|nr:hypothetical protein [Desulfobacterales bacterium]
MKLLRWNQVVVLFYLGLFVCFAIAQPNVTHAAEWTFMVYIGGDNNLSDAAITDVEEMKQASIHTNVNVIVQIECSSNYTFKLPEYLPDYNTHRLEIKTGQVRHIGSLGNIDMANPNNLREFIQWSASTYPASKYALTIWDHGAGWKQSRNKYQIYKGAVEDQTSNTFMSLAQLGQGIRESGVHFSVLDFDACLMAMYEVTYEFIGLVDFLVFSEEVEAANGNPYTPILNELSQSPGMDGAELARGIVRNFVNSYRGSRNSATKSAVNMAAIPELHNQIIGLANSLSNNLDINIPTVANARATAQGYTENAYIDLISFLEKLNQIGGEVTNKASSLIGYISNHVVIAEDHYSSSYTEGGIISGNAVDGSHGLSIYLPSADLLRQGEFENYRAISCNSGQQSWASFVANFLNGSGGGNATQGNIALTIGGFAIAAIWFDDCGLYGDADVDIYVLEPDGTIGSPWIGESTPNGYFSPDSSYSGEPYEIYGTKDEIMGGEYMVVVNYYNNGYYDTYANTYMVYMDPAYGVNYWELISGEYMRTMSLYNMAPEDWTDDVIVGILYGYYTDWWVPISTQRALQSLSFEKQKEFLLTIKRISDARRGKSVKDNLSRLYELRNEYQRKE